MRSPLSFFVALLLSLSPFYAFGENEEEVFLIEEERIGVSVADRFAYFKDEEGAQSAMEILKGDELSFQKDERKRKHFSFDRSTFWFKGKVRNKLKGQGRFFLEATRPLTNVVELHIIEDGRIVKTMEAGDQIPYSDRYVDSRKNVFPVELTEDEELEFLLKVRGEGESLVVPIIFWTPESFFSDLAQEQLVHGVFYGIFVFVFLIFGFFYKVLKENSFLFYILYILWFGLLQFSIDAYSYRFFFQEHPWMSDRLVLFASALTIILLLLYARSFLKIPQRSKKLDFVFKGFLALGGALFLTSFLPGSLARICNPLLNAFSFISVLFVLSSIFFLNWKGFQVSSYFLTAYIFLICGAVIFILGNTGVLESNAFTLNGLKFGGLGEVIFLSFSMAEKYRNIQREKEFAQEEALEHMKELNRVKDEYNQELETKVEERTRDLEEERAKLAQINREMMSSIRYAERIQRSILPPEDLMGRIFRDHFVLYKPRDVVSGDIYWSSALTDTPSTLEFEETLGERELGLSGLSLDHLPRESSLKFFSVMDCTGHGVPGAFLTFVGQSLLAQAKKERVRRPAQMLSYLDRNLKATLTGLRSETHVQDGMDMGLCLIDQNAQRLEFAGANLDCYIVRGGELIVLKGDRQGIGGDPEDEKHFSEQVRELQEGDLIYLFSDGYPDQFGGPNGKKFKYGRFRELLVSLHEKELGQQKEALEDHFKDWKGDLEQVDDVCVMGVKV